VGDMVFLSTYGIFTHGKFMRVTHGTLVFDTYGRFLTYHMKTCGRIQVVTHGNIQLSHNHGDSSMTRCEVEGDWVLKLLFYSSTF